VICPATPAASSPRSPASDPPAIVTKHGTPVAAVIAIPPGDLEDFVLSHAASFLDDMATADADLAAGRTRPAAEVFAEPEG
jgi:antitoxin (DNA-binding transcriptional repressor) of toxin-antitoxin stability system